MKKLLIIIGATIGLSTSVVADEWPRKMWEIDLGIDFGPSDGPDETDIEYLCINHNNEYIKDREFYTIAADWMKYQNNVIIQWNGSRVRFDMLYRNLEDFD